MPGRLMMEQQGVTGSQDFKRDRAMAQEANLPPRPDFALQQDAPPVRSLDNHAANGSLSNGVPVQQVPITNGNNVAATAAPSDAPSPPPLDRSWRDTHTGNKSMGILIERLAQMCFEDLNTALTKMTETTVGTVNAQPNGISPQQVDPSEASLSKKRTFMEFANGQRDRFIKTLVLSDWARKSEEMSRLVDIKVMFDQRNGMQRHAIDFIGHIKHDIQRAKIPNPNIDLAMELLATGKTLAQPHFGYIAPKKLTAKETLRTLRNMNVSLETRLNLHEELPPHFSDFSVANGKATFRVPGEFEVDLAIADEDVTSQFYFINVRFLFSPSPGEIHEALRQQLEMRTNNALVEKGLQGGYEFLHNFVLTHKINTLFDQARELERERWFGCVNIQKSRRVVTVQYWHDSPGRKSWIEIAVSTGKQHQRSKRRATPQLSVRWFRRGEHVQDHGLQFDWETLDVERILGAVVAKHTSWILATTKDRLQTLAGAGSKLVADMQSSEDVPEDCCLTLRLPDMQKPLAVRVEAVTGRISISPSTRRSVDIEARLSQQADADISAAVANLLCNTVKDRVDKTAELVGWSTFQEPIRTDNFKRLFGADVPSWRAYVPNKTWASSPQNSQWVILPVFSLVGIKWWTVLFESKPPGTQNAALRSISKAREIPVAAEPSSSIPRALLLRIEELAVEEATFAVLSEQLASEKIPHREQKASSLTADDGVISKSIAMSTMLIQTHGLLRATTSGKKLSFVDSVKITIHGFAEQERGGDDPCQIQLVIRLTVGGSKLKFLRAYFTSNRRQGADIAMTRSGGLALRLRVPFGQPCFDRVKDVLASCERIDTYLSVLHGLQIKPTLVSTTKFSFVYSRNPEAAATLMFGKTSTAPATLKLEPPVDNPQQRLRVSMENLFNTPMVANSFYVLCHCLKYTLPMMKFFEGLEKSKSAGQDVDIIIRHASFYRLTYKSPLPAWAFNIELKVHRRNNGSRVCVWRISADKASTPRDMESSAFGRALLGLAKHKGDDWQGLEDGTLVAQPNGAVAALESLDKLVRNFKESDEDKNASRQDQVKATQPPPSGPQKSQANSNGPMSENTAVSKTNGNATATATIKGRNNSQAKVKKEVIELD